MIIVVIYRYGRSGYAWFVVTVVGDDQRWVCIGFISLFVGLACGMVAKIGGDLGRFWVCMGLQQYWIKFCDNLCSK